MYGTLGICIVKTALIRLQTDPSFQSLHLPDDPILLSTAQFNFSFKERKSEITEAIIL